ncbi:MAG: type II toxin-antitoxin system RelE/ParE family toxin [Chitinophagaceae bacterium]|nr:MAG: type II toxin-antitoxin system RelE/ParE family toxin [Chitinophagaceae bacterium]
MNYRYVMHEEAVKDLVEAYLWYEKQREGLGGEFLSAIRNIVLRISLNPEVFAERSNRGYREAMVRKFPYSVVFSVYKRKKEIFISSVHHHKRDPYKKYRT